jgi:AcrR family transcriptional regulator
MVGRVGSMARDAEATKERIFDAASTEFADHGLAGARIDAIAKRAGANKQLIYAYFGSKEELFAAVLRRQLARIDEDVVLQPDRLPEFAGEVFDFHAEHPELARLLISEALSYRSGPVPDQETRDANKARKVKVVREGQETGTIDPSLEPSDLLLFIIALAIWPVAAPQVARQFAGQDPEDPKVRSRYRASLVEAVRRIVTPLAERDA